MRHPAFLRLMNRLALGAMLVLALAPSLSRVLAATPAGTQGGYAELCTVDGLKRVPLGELPAGAQPDAPPHGMGEDCAYCPLLQATITPSLALAWFAPPQPGADFDAPAPAARFLPVADTGLGSRGPPHSA